VWYTNRYLTLTRHVLIAQRLQIEAPRNIKWLLRVTFHANHLRGAPNKKGLGDPDKQSAVEKGDYDSCFLPLKQRGAC